jgi:hypothetical protein
MHHIADEITMTLEAHENRRQFVQQNALAFEDAKWDFIVFWERERCERRYAEFAMEVREKQDREFRREQLRKRYNTFVRISKPPPFVRRKP